MFFLFSCARMRAYEMQREVEKVMFCSSYAAFVPFVVCFFSRRKGGPAVLNRHADPDLVLSGPLSTQRSRDRYLRSCTFFYQLCVLI